MLDRIVSAIEKAGGLFLLAVAVLTFVMVILRKFFDTSIPDWFDFSRLLRPRSHHGVSVIGFSVPVFVLGYVLILVFPASLGWLTFRAFSRSRRASAAFSAASRCQPWRSRSSMWR